jgi:hypothetical protein
MFVDKELNIPTLPTIEPVLIVFVDSILMLAKDVVIVPALIVSVDTE